MNLGGGLAYLGSSIGHIHEMSLNIDKLGVCDRSFLYIFKVQADWALI